MSLLYWVTQTHACPTARCYCYRLFSKVYGDLWRGVRGARLRAALFRGRFCLIVAFFIRFISPQPSLLCFAQGMLIAGRGRLVARGRLLFDHGHRELYWRPLFLIVW